METAEKILEPVILCPCCGAEIPMCRGGPESVRHLVIHGNGKMVVVCPKRLAEVLEGAVQ